MGVPRIPDIATMRQAGIGPNGLPLRFDDGRMKLKDDIKRVLRVNDEQICINRFKWYNLPDDLDGQLLERILYYKGQGAFFYMKDINRFFFLPYALDGTIDVYGRYTGITPVPLASATANDNGKPKAWIEGLVFKPRYDIIGFGDEFTAKDLYGSCVLLSDYSKQLSQTVIPRQQLNESIIDVESDMIPYLRTALRNSTGVTAMRVGSQDEYTAVESASKSINEAALMGHKYIPVIGQLDFQDLSGSNVAVAEEFLMSMQSLDNFRLGTIGLENGGLFQKKAHELQSESNLNMGGGIGPIMQDGLTLRQKFCDIVNSIWGLGIWCEPSETESGDTDMNGITEDNQAAGSDQADGNQEATNE